MGSTNAQTVVAVWSEKKKKNQQSLLCQKKTEKDQVWEEIPPPTASGWVSILDLQLYFGRWVDSERKCTTSGSAGHLDRAEDSAGKSPWVGEFSGSLSIHGNAFPRAQGGREPREARENKRRVA